MAVVEVGVLLMCVSPPVCVRLLVRAQAEQGHVEQGHVEQGVSCSPRSKASMGICASRLWPERGHSSKQTHSFTHCLFLDVSCWHVLNLVL